MHRTSGGGWALGSPLGDCGGRGRGYPEVIYLRILADAVGGILEDRGGQRDP